MTSIDKAQAAKQTHQKALRYKLDHGCCPQCALATATVTHRVVGMM